MKKLLFALILIPSFISAAGCSLDADDDSGWEDYDPVLFEVKGENSAFDHVFPILPDITEKNIEFLKKITACNLKDYFVNDPGFPDKRHPRPYQKESDITFVLPPEKAVGFRKFLFIIGPTSCGQVHVWVLTHEQGPLAYEQDIIEPLARRTRDMYNRIFYQTTLKHIDLAELEKLFVGFVIFVNREMFIVEDESLNPSDYRYDACTPVTNWILERYPEEKKLHQACYEYLPEQY